MSKTMVRVFGLMLLMTLLIAGIGCAGSRMVERTEAGYVPTHFAVGNIIAYTQGQGMIKQSDLERLIVQHLEDAFYNDDMRYIPKRDLDDSGVPAEKTALINLEVTFLPSPSGMANSYDIRFTYSVVRQSDGKLFDEGSAKSTDASVSTGGTLDLDSAIEYASIATVQKIKSHVDEVEMP